MIQSALTSVCVCVTAAVLECLFSSNSKIRFRAKIRIILKKLCRKFGYERILQLAPETDRKLVHHLQKQARRGDRITAEQKARQQQEQGGRSFEAMMGDDESGSEADGDGDDEEEWMSLGGDGTMVGPRTARTGLASRHSMHDDRGA